MLLGKIYKSVVSSIKSNAASKAAQAKVGDLGYGKYEGSKITTGSAYPSSKTTFQKTKDTVLMDLGVIPKDAYYYSTAPANKKKSQEMLEQMMKSASKDSAPSKPKGPSKAEIALAKRKAEGQAARKKFEKEKGEKRIALRKRYLKLLKLA